MAQEASLHELRLAAANHHQAGRLDEAEALYREVLRRNPEDRDANHNLGVLTLQRSADISKALPHFRIAWNVDPSHAQHGLSYLRALVLAGEFDEARRVHAEGLGRGLPWPSIETLRNNAAARRTPRPLAEAPSPAEVQALFDAYAAGDHGRFESLARSLCGRYPDHGIGWKGLGVAAIGRQNRDEAVRCLRVASQLLPDDAEVHAGLGNVLRELGLLAEAQVALNRALILTPRNVAAHLALGDVLLRLHRLDEAGVVLGRALALDPESAQAHCGLARTFLQSGRWSEAESSYREALRLQPAYREAQAGLGTILVRQQRLSEAEAHYRTIIAHSSSDANAACELGKVLTSLGRTDEAQSVLRGVIERHPGHLKARSALVFLMHYSATEKPERAFEEARSFGRAARAQARAFHDWSCSRDQRLRVGLVSGDLHQHPVGYFLESVLTSGDFSRIDWVGYPTVGLTDALTARLKTRFAEWHPLVGLDDESAARRIHGDGIHVLVDLSGHTADNRLPVFAWRPAPVQLTWLGYFATTGLDEIDYLIADETGIPRTKQNVFTEAIRYLPETRLCFSQPEDAPVVAPLPALVNQFVTFGSFQAIPKITDEVLSTWSSILAACPGSCLRIQSNSLADPQTRGVFSGRLARQNIDSARVQLHGSVSRKEYLEAYRFVDIILDTFPYPGGTTTCEALWMGVPTLSLAGESMIARQGASLLHAANLEEWIVQSRDDYVKQAVINASDLSRLATLRAELRERVRRSPLFDATRFAHFLEKAIVEMWNERAAQGIKQPEKFAP